MSVRKYIRQQAKKGRFVESVEVDYFPGSHTTAVYLVYPDFVDTLILKSPFSEIKGYLLSTFNLLGVNNFSFNELNHPSVH